MEAGPLGEFPGCWCQEEGLSRGGGVSHRRQFPAQESSGRLGQISQLGSQRGKVKPSWLALVLVLGVG